MYNHNHDILHNNLFFIPRSVCMVVNQQLAWPTEVTVLMCACMRGEDITTRLLFKHCAGVTLYNKNGLSHSTVQHGVGA